VSKHHAHLHFQTTTLANSASTTASVSAEVIRRRGQFHFDRLTITYITLIITPTTISIQHLAASRRQQPLQMMSTLDNSFCMFAVTATSQVRELDARQSQTLARLATPLAACVQRISCLLTVVVIIIIIMTVFLPSVL